MVSPTATTTYTLVASNATGSVTARATVTVTAPALSWAKDMQPIFVPACTRCHGGMYPTAGLSLETYNGTMSVVTPGDPNSRLVQMTKQGGPMYGYLPNPAVQSQLIYQWVMDGAKP
jgi:hypothetical protein